MFPESGIHIISATLNSHVAGRKMKLRHIRNGIELDRIVEDDNYDYNYQQVRQLEKEVTILPGDYIITDCAYEVSNFLIYFYLCIIVHFNQNPKYLNEKVHFLI